MIRILPFGAFHNRQPLAYAPIRARLAGQVELVNTPSEAQILLISHHKDLELYGTRLLRLLAARPALRVVLLSEEPFWDSCWAPDPFSRYQGFATPEGVLPYAVLNHHTSAIYRAQRIPYFLLTDPRYIAHYRPLFDRNAGRSAAEWLAHFRDVPLDAGFIGEKRSHDRHNPAFPAQDVWGLSVFRSRFTHLCTAGRVLRAGKGWSDGPPRQELPDWHADKLALLDLRCRYVAGFENTHQADYLSEKIYDAFAVGAVPLYVAGKTHAVHRLVGPAGWLNFYAPPPKATAFDPRRPVTATEAADYAAVQARLAVLFQDPAATETELDRLTTALMAEFRRLLC